ncbi:hypothetical protein A9Q84_13955 [Halobacteriovorax marinus]|uniref:Uncharacterized protein n=1 Tax=Halobacteriovorax marinus TaxID=97084 RepID=A0A1Y5F9G8_9BACT|nr:hypothetical protein A9Q84_13955 [Halobacteriovorax marinus]
MFIVSFNIKAQDILCIPNDIDAPFDRVELKKIKNHKYSIVVKKSSKVLLTDHVSYVFLRRKQYGRFRNKKQTVIIKTKRLIADQPKRSSLKVEILSSDSFIGKCKLYPAF